MSDRPNCKCHGEPMFWSKDKRTKRGGYWRCLVLKREQARRYARSERGRALNNKYSQQYRRTEKGRASRRRYSQSEKGRKLDREQVRRYRQTERGAAVTYIREVRRNLRRQRALVLKRLAEIEAEERSLRERLEA